MPALDHLDPVVGRVRHPDFVEAVLHDGILVVGLAEEKATTMTPKTTIMAATAYIRPADASVAAFIARTSWPRSAWLISPYM